MCKGILKHLFLLPNEKKDVEVEEEIGTTTAIHSPAVKHLGSHFDGADTAQEATAPPVERMKNDLAAELVLSPDSGNDEEDDDDEGVRGNLSTEEMGDFYPLRNASVLDQRAHYWATYKQSTHYYMLHTSRTRIASFFAYGAALYVVHWRRDCSRKIAPGIDYICWNRAARGYSGKVVEVHLELGNKLEGSYPLTRQVTTSCHRTDPREEPMLHLGMEGWGEGRECDTLHFNSQHSLDDVLPRGYYHLLWYQSDNYVVI
ncbi:hypothetical protein ECG_06126 [Echinococcus granulosus]|nr:hypothetical protein ECG_06126 [Echinococcus granulosus]